MSDNVHYGKRKSKNDKRKKKRYNVYKKGGKFRTQNVKETSSEKKGKK